MLVSALLFLLFYLLLLFWCSSRKLQLGGSSSGQIPPVVSDTHSVTGSWSFPCFPHALSKGSRAGQPAGWLGFCLGKVELTMGTLGLCLMWQAGRDLCWLTGSCHFGANEGSFVSKQKLLFVQPVARGCSLLCWRELCAPAGLFASPGSHAFSSTWAVWATDHPSWLQKHQITPPLCWRGAIVFRAGKSPSSNKL